jgi:hypothetical protein
MEVHKISRRACRTKGRGNFIGHLTNAALIPLERVYRKCAAFPYVRFGTGDDGGDQPRAILSACYSASMLNALWILAVIVVVIGAYAFASRDQSSH